MRVPQLPNRSRMARLMIVGLAATTLAAPVALGQGGRAEPGDQPRGRPEGGRGGMGGGMGGGMPGFGGRTFLGGAADMMAPSISEDGIAAMEKMLKLTPDQSRALKEAYIDYQDRYKVEAAEVQAKIERAIQEARESGNNAGARSFTAPVQEFRTAAADMDEEFLRHFKGMLTAEQAAKWPAVERARRRDRAAAGGIMTVSGERVDLVKLLDQIRIPDGVRAELAPLMEQYEQELDKELVNRAKVNDEMAASMADIRAAGGMEEMRQKLQEMQGKMHEAGARVAEVNRRYAAKVQSMLPEDRRPGFARALKEARFVDVYRPSGAARALATAAEFPDLDEAQKAKLKTLRDNYNREVTAINDKLAAATEQAEANPTPIGMRPQGGQGRGGRGQANPAFELRRSKADLDSSTMESLRAMLTAEQREKLPRLPERAFGAMGGQGRQGGPGGQGGDAPQRRRGGRDGQGGQNGGGQRGGRGG